MFIGHSITLSIFSQTGIPFPFVSEMISSSSTSAIMSVCVSYPSLMSEIYPLKLSRFVLNMFCGTLVEFMQLRNNNRDLWNLFLFLISKNDVVFGLLLSKWLLFVLLLFVNYYLRAKISAFQNICPTAFPKRKMSKPKLKLCFRHKNISIKASKQAKKDCIP